MSSDYAPTANASKILTTDPTPTSSLSKSNDVLKSAIFNDQSILEQAEGIRSSVISFLVKYELLLLHITSWAIQNYNPLHGKDESHIDQRNLPVDPDVVINNRKINGSELVKFQLHRVAFTSNNDFIALSNILNNFENIVDPSVIECVKHTTSGNDPKKLNEGDEFRWRVSPEKSSGIRKIYDVEKEVQELFGDLTQKVIDILSKRRFDVRIIKIDMRSDTVEFTAQTLWDHPYAGRRTWKLIIKRLKTNLMETAEVNTFPWLPDLVFELLTNGEDARLNWEKFLRRFVTRSDFSAGNITDAGLLRGYTIYGDKDTIRNDATVQQIFPRYSDLSNEFERLNI